MRAPKIKVTEKPDEFLVFDTTGQVWGYQDFAHAIQAFLEFVHQYRIQTQTGYDGYDVVEEIREVQKMEAEVNG